MAERLQVTLPGAEYRKIQRLARSMHVSVEAWVRQALKVVAREKPRRSIRQKLEAVRRAALYEFPTADIGLMLAETESPDRPSNP